ncbi:MAG: lipopolysaccharide biosynthesis protein, partial [Ignavibacteria bacterium GWB2_35_6b]
MNIKKHAVSGVKWSSTSQVGLQGLQFITTIVLARLLSPADYGLMGMTMVWIGFINIFKDLGTSAAIIQRKDLTETTLSSIFWINLAFGFIAMTILFIIASLISNFYHEPRLINMLRVLSCTFLIASISIMQQAILERDMAFDKVAKIELASVTFSSFIGIILAFLEAGVWSLVYKTVAEIALTTILLWIFVAWKPKMVFVWQEVKSVSKFSLNLTGFNIFNYFSRNTDYLLIGKFLGAQDLGYYTMVYRIMLFPLQNLSRVIGRVFFPIFSKIQDDNIRFKRVYLNVVGTIALVTFPMMVGLFAVSKPFVLTILGQQWKPIIILLMILSPVGMLQSVGTTVGIIYQAKGRTDWMFRWGIFSGIVVIS